MFNLDSSLGIALQGSDLILASVKKGLQDYSLQKHMVVEGFRQLAVAELHDRIRRFVKSNGFSRENIILGLPREEVVVRELEFPAEVQENLDQVIRSQVDRLEPSEEERSYYDYLVVNRDEENSKVHVQIVMIRQGLLDDYLSLLRDLDLYPAAVRYTSLGLQSVLLAHADGPPKRAAVAMLNLAGDSVQMLVVIGRRHVYSRSVPFGSEKPEVAQLLRELNVFVSQLDPGVEELVKIYLSGEGAADALPEFREAVGDCELLSANLRLGRKGVAEQTLNRILPAIGLAVSGIGKLETARLNLIPKDKRLRGGRPSLVATYVLVVALLACLGGLATRNFFQGQALVDQLEDQVQVMQARVDEVFRLREEVATQRAEVEELQGILSGRQRVLFVLRDLTERIPDDAYLQTVQMQGSEISMQGFSDQASDLLTTLLQSPYLDNVKTNWINKDPRSGKDRFNFSARVKDP